MSTKTSSVMVTLTNGASRLITFDEHKKPMAVHRVWLINQDTEQGPSLMHERMWVEGQYKNYPVRCALAAAEKELQK